MKRPLVLFSILTMLFAASTVVGSQTPKETALNTKSATAEKIPVEPHHEMTAADVGAFLDGFVPMQLARENIAGAVVLVVKDGQVLFAKGYGYSDVEKKTPVYVDATLFRPGSISKLFTWTAVMQLVEQGKLDLDRDINSYIDFKIPAAFGKPITLRNLMTHTPGFEEQIKDLINNEGVPIAGLREHLVRHMPEQIFPPGTISAYSNYGAALAGYIVERVSGKPFNEYVSANIFQPLGMARTTFAQPLPDDLKPLMSRGYYTGSGKAKPFEIIEESPAGALSATAADLSRFMIAHLQDGSFGPARILRPETARLMHSRQFGLNSALNGMCLGFYEESRNGQRIIGHGGDTIYFHSDLHLMLDAGVGFFVSYNSAGKGEISPRTALWNYFLDRYFPYTPPEVQRPSTAASDARSVAGTYFSSRRSQTNFLRVSYMVSEVNVVAKSNGDLQVEPSKDFRGEIKTWQEIGPMLYRDLHSQDMIAFRRDDRGRWQLLLGFPAILYQHSSFLQDRTVNQSLIISCLTVMALNLLFWPIAGAVRRHYHHRLELGDSQRRARTWIRMVCALDLIFAIGLIILTTTAGVGNFNEKLDLRVNLFQVIGVLGALGTVLVLIGCLRLMKDRAYWFWARMWNLLVLLACLGFIWFVLYWNVLDFRMNY
ncbi:MAG TPA: serine hydrolase domain-containing protein [Candidatus Angelobacter sp.]|nr:serine hydrolase domain-containing protein [Candidatus Angelobacter sp.]